MWRYELSGEQFDAIRPLPPARNSKGCPACEDRQLLDGMFWVLCAASPRRDTPARYGPWQTVYDRFRKWRRNAQRAYHGGRPLAFGKQLYRSRNITEHRINWIKNCRRLPQRYGKNALCYLAMVKLRFIRVDLNTGF